MYIMEKIKKTALWLIKTHLGRLTLSAILLILGSSLYKYALIDNAIYLVYISGAYMVAITLIMTFFGFKNFIGDIISDKKKKKKKKKKRKKSK